MLHKSYVKFIYSEKATKFWEIFILLLSRVHTEKSKVKILQNFVAVALSEYMSFMMFLVDSYFILQISDAKKDL